VEEVSEVAAASSELKPGERKVISDGTEGPVVEIIKKTTSATEPTEAPEDSESQASKETTEAEDTGE